MSEDHKGESFKDWWEREGRHWRSGGGNHEMSFAARAWDRSELQARASMAGGFAPGLSTTAVRKLQTLLDRGYCITGYALEKPQEGAPPDRGFIDHGGFVGWWRGDDEWNASVELAAERKAQLRKKELG